ncbi:calponin-3-like isoform X1 [Panonychus citri]|uniref:calponin-3-like isoform X1 n=1 Tax=Panonychus citri TaxID=50023 RepID=UPI0023082150|nr:calponin-3-like isoform X1 [Panonychus citri]
MAFQGPAYGLSRELLLKSQAKFDIELANQALNWVQAVTNTSFNLNNNDDNNNNDNSTGIKDQFEFAEALKDGIALCNLINGLAPGSIGKVNKMKTPFKERENIELFLKACEAYGLRNHDLFQVNDLYERKNLYMVVNCLHSLGGLAQKKGYQGPVIGIKTSDENKREFDEETLKKGRAMIGLQSGSNSGASQAKMTPYGASRQIIPG